MMEMELNAYNSGKLTIAYYDLGKATGPALFLLHGWPDDASAWTEVIPGLVKAGYRLIVPFLRGFGSTFFNDENTIRDGSAAAIAQDAIDLANGLGIYTSGVAGHDWGARAAYQLAILFPDRVKAIGALALGYQPYGEFKMPDFKQAKNFWYQWLMLVDAGAQSIAEDPVGFAKIQWDNWSPKGWFKESVFEWVSDSFRHPDWVAITLNGYRRRFKWEPSDPDYADLTRKIAATAKVVIPTLLIQGEADRCDPPHTSEGLEAYFENGYERIILPCVGHFPMREASKSVTDALLKHFGKFDLK